MSTKPEENEAGPVQHEQRPSQPLKQIADTQNEATEDAKDELDKRQSSEG